jgi:tetratricopeptide (TPR) repeat protein
MRERKRRGPADHLSDDGSGGPSESTSGLGRNVKARLEELLAFAQVYRGWSAKELAKFIGRDVHNVIPASGVPKIDLVAKLAEALDWQPGAAFDHLCGGQIPTTTTSPGPSVTDYRQLNREAYKAFEAGRFEDMIALGLRMEHVATSPDERAEACLRQYGGWDGLGRYERAMEALQRGLKEQELQVPLLLHLRGNLAITYFLLGRWLEAEGVAAAVLERIETPEGLEDGVDAYSAVAHYARGLARRSRAFAYADQRRRVAQSAIADLRVAERDWRSLAARTGALAYLPMAHISAGAAVTAEVLTDSRSATEVLGYAVEEIGRCPDAGPATYRSVLESFGWWCVFGAEVALASEQDPASQERWMAQFTIKGLAIAEATGHWALRERFLTVDYLRWSRRLGAHSLAESMVLDQEDVQMIAGAMARFPDFRPFGWELVRRATRTN